jgi:hypothetical protein
MPALILSALKPGGGEVYGFGLLANKQYAGQLLSPFTRYRTKAALDLAENCAEGVACGVL